MCSTKPVYFVDKGIVQWKIFLNLVESAEKMKKMKKIKTSKIVRAI